MSIPPQDTPFRTAAGSGLRPAATIPLLLLALFLLGTGLFIRFHALERVPAGLHRDEAVNGCEALCFSRTGRDLHGTFLPLHFRAFDDYRECLFLDTMALLVGRGGLSVFTVRLNAALWGLLGTAGAGLLAWRLYGPWGGACAALSLVLMPWHIYLSRYGIRSVSAPCVLAWALFCFFHWLAAPAPRRRGWLPASGLLLGLGFHTYTPAEAVLPGLVAVLAVLYRKPLARERGATLTAGALMLALAVPALYQAFCGEALTRFAHLSVARHTSSLSGEAWMFARNYFAHWNPGFLFFNQQPNRWVPGETGLLQFTSIPLLALFTLRAVARRNPEDLLLATWLLLAPVPAALTSNRLPHLIRMVLATVPAAVACGGGVCEGFSRLSTLLPAPRARAASAGLVLLFLAGTGVETSRFLDRYFGPYAVHSADYFQSGYLDLMQWLRSHDANYRRVIFLAPHNDDFSRRPFVFFLFDRFQAHGFEPVDFTTITLRMGIATRFFDRYEVILDRGTSEPVDARCLLVTPARYDYAPRGLALLHTVRNATGHPVFRVWTGGLQASAPARGA